MLRTYAGMVCVWMYVFCNSNYVTVGCAFPQFAMRKGERYFLSQGSFEALVSSSTTHAHVHSVCSLCRGDVRACMWKVSLGRLFLSMVVRSALLSGQLCVA